MKRSGALFTIVVFLFLALAPVAASANTCPGDDLAADEAYKFATLQAEGQSMFLDTIDLEAFARATLQAEGQVYIPVPLASCGS